MGFNNISDGTTNGFGLVFVKDGVILPVALTEGQCELLDLSLIMVFMDEPPTVVNHPMGKAIPLKELLKEK